MGHWKGGRLEAERSSFGGAKITEVSELKDDGRTLVVHTKIEPGGERPGIEFKRVYARVQGE